ncbi:hypothetical protein HaLaN_33137, partial [Haematococcus lacustris]
MTSRAGTAQPRMRTRSTGSVSSSWWRCWSAAAPSWAMRPSWPSCSSAVRSPPTAGSSARRHCVLRSQSVQPSSCISWVVT